MIFPDLRQDLEFGILHPWVPLLPPPTLTLLGYLNLIKVGT